MTEGFQLHTSPASAQFNLPHSPGHARPHAVLSPADCHREEPREEAIQGQTFHSKKRGLLDCFASRVMMLSHYALQSSDLQPRHIFHLCSASPANPPMIVPLKRIYCRSRPALTSMIEISSFK